MRQTHDARCDASSFSAIPHRRACWSRFYLSSAVWLKVPVDFCHYISIAAHYGFKFHHTQPKYVMMSLWLPEDVPNKIPEFGTHHLGVAGMSTRLRRAQALLRPNTM